MRDLVAARPARLWLRVEGADGARAFLANRRDIASVGEDPDGRLVLELRGAEPAVLNRELMTAGFDVAELVCRPPTFESLFREVVEAVV